MAGTRITRFSAAAKVGGILANSTRPAEFLYENLSIETNVIHAAKDAGCESYCFWPPLASIRE